MTRRMAVVVCRMKSSSLEDDVSAVVRQMTGGIRGGIAAIGLCAAMMFAASSNFVFAASVTKLYGADVSRLIMKRLADEGLQGTPSIKSDRIFPACDSVPVIEPMFGSWHTVAVRCKAGSGWRFAIRTNLSSRPAPVPIREFLPGSGVETVLNSQAIERAVSLPGTPQTGIDEIEVVALSRSISRNDMIGADDLMMVAVSERNAMGAFFNLADVIGRRAKIGVGMNQPVMARHLHPDYLVEEGSEVLITSSAGGITVDMVGYALENGQIGEWIGVENASSGKIIRGKITGEKKVGVIAKK